MRPCAHAPVALPLQLPIPRYYPIRIRRQAAATLLDLVTNSKANQRTLAALPAPTVDRAFGDFLGAAADYATQVKA